jgi:hypothetical protein
LSANDRSNDLPIGDIMAQCFLAECENAALRRLVISLTLAIPFDLLPDDERVLFSAIINGDPDD